MTTASSRPDRSAVHLEGRSAGKKRPVLYALVRELLRLDRFQDFSSALPARARVSEPALPLLLAALHEQLDRAVSVLVPEDADARDVAEAASWYVGAERVALLPSRGVRWDSGLRPPPHLVGERARALDVLEQGGLVVVSATALAEGMPPAAERPAPIRLQPGEEHGLETLTEELALAGYERVERAEERGQFAVRGDLVDVFPTTGREPLRVEFFGDEIEQVRAFSPFTQRALHDVDDAFVYPAAERRLWLADDEELVPAPPNDLVRVLPDGPDVVWERAEVLQLWEEEGLGPIGLSRATELDQLPSGQPFSFEAQRPALAARGLSEAENEVTAFVRAGHRVIVAFPHRGDALRTENLLRRVDAPLLEPGDVLSEEPQARFAVSPARRGFVWRDLNLVLLPDTQLFRKRARRPEAARIGRALQSFADLRSGDYVAHEDHGIGKVSRYIGADASAPSLSKLGGKAWQHLKTRARTSVRELAGELLALYAQRQQAQGEAYDLRHEWLQRLEADFFFQ